MSEVDKNRIFWLSCTFVVLFSALIFQFFNIQWIEGEKWQAQADRQHYFIVREPFKRGVFLANADSRVPLVHELQRFHLYIDPQSLPEEHRKCIADRLIEFLDLPLTKQGKCRRQFLIQSRSRKIAMWLGQDTKSAIEAWWFPFSRKHKIARNALYFVHDYKRSYPFGHLLGPVLHTVRNIRDEKTKEAFPTGGLELSLHSYLKGREGKRRLMRSPRHALEMGQVITSPQNGATVTLTINHHLQSIVEEELSKGVIKSKAKGGWAIMMDPNSGEILALAQYPFFDPTHYSDYFNDPNLITTTKLHGITDAHEIGSVMKPFTVLVAFLANEELERRGEAPLFDPEEKMSTSDGRFPGRSKPISDTHRHNFLNMDMAVQKSSNIYLGRLMQRVIERLGDEWYRKMLQEKFHFGKKTGIELPAESPGLLPRIGKKHPNGKLEWSKATPYSLAMGHNIMVPGIQMIKAYALLANRGKLVTPTIIRKIEQEETGEIFLDNTSHNHYERTLSEEIVERVIDPLCHVTHVGGTARSANIPGYTEIGKTGTANKVVNGMYAEKKFVSSFIGFAPSKNPAFVLLVTLDEPQYGPNSAGRKNHMAGTCSAPIFREIAKKSLAFLGVMPDDSYGYPSGDPRRDVKKSAFFEKRQQLIEKYEKWNH